MASDDQLIGNPRCLSKVKKKSTKNRWGKFSLRVEMRRNKEDTHTKKFHHFESLGHESGMIPFAANLVVVFPNEISIKANLRTVGGGGRSEG